MISRTRFFNWTPLLSFGSRSWGLFLSALFLLASKAHAELPSPRLDRINIMGAAAGSSVEIEVQGADLEEANRLVFDHPGLKAEHVKDRRFKISVAAEVPPGTYDLFVVGKYGISNPRLFAVSKGFTELMEKEPNDDPSTAQVVSLDSIINGTSDGNKEDMYRFKLKKGQRIVLECHAGKLESLMDATMTLTTADGKPIASNGDYDGRDPLIDFTAPEDGEYLVSVYDLSFRGGHPYRLIFNTKPQIENVFPRAIQVGKATPLTVFGRNFGSVGKPSPWAIQDQILDQWTDSFTAPAEGFTSGRYTFHDHPTNHSVLPTAATCTLVGMQYRAKFGDVLTNSVPMVLTDVPVTLEVEPNDDPKKPQPITLPAIVSGRFDKERDADWYEFEPKEDGSYLVEVYCERISGRGDPYAVILDDKDNRVVELDDYGHRINAFDGHLRDPSGQVNLTKNRKYRILVQDRYRRGGARFQYVLSICKAVPDFFPAVIHHQNPGPGGCNLRKGGTTHVDVVIHYKDGVNAPVTISAEGLPKGVHVQPTTITGDTRGSLILWADADAEDFVGPIRLIATSPRPTGEIRREVRAYCRSWSNQDLNSSRPMRELMLAVRETGPFLLTPEKDRVEIMAGNKLTLKMQLDRRWPDFKNSVNLIPLNFPGPIKMGNVSIGEGKTEATITLDVAANAKPGEYTISVTGQAQVPFIKESKESKAGTKANTLVSLPSKPITVVVTGNLGKK